MCWVMPPASPAATRALRMASAEQVAKYIPPPARPLLPQRKPLLIEPAVQTVQVDARPAPVALEKVPAGQGVCLVACAAGVSAQDA